MLWVVAPPGDQTLPAAVEEVKMTLPPAQNVVGPPAVIVGAAGGAVTVTVTGVDAADVQPVIVWVTL